MITYIGVGILQGAKLSELKGAILNNSLSALKEALRNGDADEVLQRGFHCHVLLPNEEITADIVPTNPDWAWPSLAQGFALLFNGYDWEEETNISPFSLLQQAEQGKKTLQSFTLTELRVILFALQRSYRDAYGEPDPTFVKALFEAIKHKVESGLLE